MSLLLDALRKAEQERRQSQPISPFEPVAAPLPLRPTARPRYRTAAVLSAVVLLCGAALWLQERPAQRHVAPSPHAQAPAAPAPPQPVAPPSVEQEPAGLAELALPAELEAPGSLSGMSIPPPRPLAREQRAAARTASPAAVARPAPTAVAEAPVPAPQASVQPASTPAVERIALAPAPTLSTERAGAAMAVPRVNQLPDAERARWPALRFDVHVWNADPARRFVLVDGNRYREGDRFREGPRIVEIVPEGVIAEHEGSLALVPRPG